MASETTYPQCDLSYEILKSLEKEKRDELIKKIEEEERIEENKLKNNPNLPLERKLQAVHDELKDLKTELDIMRNSLDINMLTIDDKINYKFQCPYLKSQNQSQPQIQTQTQLQPQTQPTLQCNLQCPLRQQPQKNNQHQNVKSYLQVYDDDEYDNKIDDWIYWFFGISLILILILDLIPPNKCIRPFTI